MGTKRLTISAPLTPTVLRPAGEPCEVEVPEGETLYLIVTDEAPETNVNFHLRHPGSRALIRSLVIGRGDAQPMLRTKVIHHSPHTQADTLVRTLTYDKAKPHYEGLIRMEKDAQDCESYLNHHTLVLSPTAGVRTIPSLEILADKVKCSHAATVRTVTEAELFYMRSRGISPEEARETLIEAFTADIPKEKGAA